MPMHTCTCAYMYMCIHMHAQVSVEAGHADGELQLLHCTHGALFGVEGAMLGLPSLTTTRVRAADAGCKVLVIGGFGISKLKSAQPALLQQLLAAAFAQQQDVTSMLTRRSAIWRGGGWAAPNCQLSGGAMGGTAAGAATTSPTGRSDEISASTY